MLFVIRGSDGSPVGIHLRLLDFRNGQPVEPVGAEKLLDIWFDISKCCTWRPFLHQVYDEKQRS